MKRKIILLLSIFSFGLFQASDIFRAIESNNKKAIQSWLQYSPDVESCNEQGQTVLMKAVQVGNKNLVYKLLKKGASVNAVDRFGRTALDYAVELHNKNIAKILVKNQGMVTTESNAVLCRDMLCKHGLWVAKVLLVTLGVVVIVGVLANSWMIVWPLAYGCISGTCILGGITLGGIALGCGSIYGGVQISKEYKSCRVDILEPMIN